MTSFRPGLCSVTFRKLAPEAIVGLAAESGIEGIEWAGDVHVPPGRYDIARHVRYLTEEAGLSVISYGSYIAPPSDDEAAFALALETAQALGAPNIRIWPGSRNRDSVTYSAEERRQAASLIRRMARQADDASITISLEYHPNSLTDDLASAQQLITEIDDPNVFLYWQPRPGLPLEEALDELRAIGSETSHVHVFAWDSAKKRYPLSEQQAYWSRILTEALAHHSSRNRRSATNDVPAKEMSIGSIPKVDSTFGIDALATRWRGDRFAMLEFVRDDSPEQFRIDAAVFYQMLKEVQDRPAGAA